MLQGHLHRLLHERISMHDSVSGAVMVVLFTADDTEMRGSESQELV